MQKVLHYLYLGENGTILSPVKLEGIYSVQKYRLTAADNHMLTKDGKQFYKSILIPASEVNAWYEVDDSVAKID